MPPITPAAAMTKPKYSGDLIFHLGIFEARAGEFFWQYRTADGSIVKECERLFDDLSLCIAHACGQISDVHTPHGLQHRLEGSEPL